MKLQTYINEADRALRQYHLSVKKIALTTLALAAIGLLGYSTYKSDVERIAEACETAQGYFISASTDSAHRREFAKKGIHAIEDCRADLDLFTFASLKHMNSLEKELKPLTK
jgi:hypothetical protein